MFDEQRPVACPVPENTGTEPPAQPLVMLAVRFLLELIAFGAIGWAGWNIGDGGVLGGILAAIFVVAAAGAWGIFAVPGDPTRNPTPVIAVPGRVRLAIELVIFGIAAWALWVFVSRAASETFLTAAGVVIVVSWDRAWWLLKQR